MWMGEASLSAPKFCAIAMLGLSVIALGACGEAEQDGTSGGGGTGEISGTAGRDSSAGAAGVGDAGGRGGGAGSSGAGVAGVPGAGAGGTAGQMPDCLPPCLWALFAGCRPKQSCTAEHEVGTNDYLECEAATGYRFESHVDRDGSHPDPDMIVQFNGALCYTANHVGSTWTYSDPSGTVVATVTAGVDGATGTCPVLDGTAGAPTAYRVDTSDPRCASIECTPGTCP